jgi:D-erythritol 1-phosphate dehydrogenase
MIPFEDRFTLVGTTDVDFAGDARAPVASEAEIDYLCRAVARYLLRAPAASDVVWRYAGVRPLYDDGSQDPSAITRDYTLRVDDADGVAPVLSVFGGKITTFRKLAEHAMNELERAFPKARKSWTAVAPLPGGDIPNGNFESFAADLAHRHPWLPAPLARHYARLYGTRSQAMLGTARSLSDLGRHFGGLLYEREVQYLRDVEWASTAEDILERRTKHGLYLDAQGSTALEQWLRAA